MYVVSVILIASVVTFVLRAAPFVVLKRLADSEVLREIGASMPIGVIVILVFYTLADFRLVFEDFRLGFE